MKIKNTRLAKAAAEATDAFWCEFASHFPEITTGDMSPDACVDFDWAVSKATGAWIDSNPPEKNIVAHCYTCKGGRVHTLRKDIHHAIWVKCSKCKCERTLDLEDVTAE